MRAVAVCVLVATILAGVSVSFAGPATPATIEDYLKQMKITPQKPQAGEYQFTLGFPKVKPEKFLVRVMPEQKLVYVAILDVAPLTAAMPKAPAWFRKLAELNYQLTVGKIEWEAERGTLRLSYTFAGEQGVDYASFVAVVQTLLTEVEAVRRALEAVK
jgi:hypothetical protein